MNTSLFEKIVNVRKNFEETEVTVEDAWFGDPLDKLPLGKEPKE